ncbi:hypothetical protein [uncultured Algibacter sp.]|uniref:hypothetical protein n=1 Tax=uncultured Algibacter sp. TaxID=298659 RepID=UPI0025F6CF37|nr:hypothetical protein [uncultured Algibacter sp.]
MPLKNDIALRPRFKMEIPRYNEAILSDFENEKTTQSEFIITRVDDHVFIKFPKDKQHFWSPQLHLEINKVDDNSSTLHVYLVPTLQFGRFLCFFIF